MLPCMTPIAHSHLGRSHPDDQYNKCSSSHLSHLCKPQVSAEQYFQKFISLQWFNLSNWESIYKVTATKFGWMINLHLLSHPHAKFWNVSSNGWTKIQDEYLWISYFSMTSTISFVFPFFLYVVISLQWWQRTYIKTDVGLSENSEF